MMQHVMQHEGGAGRPRAGLRAGPFPALAVVLALSGAAAVVPPDGRALAAEAPVVAADQEASRLVIATSRGSTEFRVELATTPEELARGLQHRRSLPADAGMLFDFGPERIARMWMKNTYIPLDMLFIGGDGVVADVAEQTEPLSLDIIASRVPIRAVLELNAGTVARLGIRRGDRVHHRIFAKP
jgi:uncharacterized membrane protein (UPF0127 family)